MPRVKTLEQLEIEDRFWDKVNKDGPIHPDCGQCWEWIAGTFNDGYGGFGAYGESRSHRVSWVIHFGPIPEGLQVLHECDTPLCVNPSHLWLGTSQDNTQDRCAKGRSAFGYQNGAYTKPEEVRRGETHGMSKLTDEIVREIRRTYIPKHPIYGQAAIARRFGVNPSTIERGISGFRWGHVK